MKISYKKTKGPILNMVWYILDVQNLITMMLDKDPQKRPTIEDIMNHQWTKDNKKIE